MQRTLMQTMATLRLVPPRSIDKALCVSRMWSMSWEMESFTGGKQNVFWRGSSRSMVCKKFRIRETALPSPYILELRGSRNTPVFISFIMLTHFRCHIYCEPTNYESKETSSKQNLWCMQHLFMCPLQFYVILTVISIRKSNLRDLLFKSPAKGALVAEWLLCMPDGHTAFESSQQPFFLFHTPLSPVSCLLLLSNKHWMNK